MIFGRHDVKGYTNPLFIDAHGPGVVIEIPGHQHEAARRWCDQVFGPAMFGGQAPVLRRTEMQPALAPAGLAAVGGSTT